MQSCSCMSRFKTLNDLINNGGPIICDCYQYNDEFELLARTSLFVHIYDCDNSPTSRLESRDVILNRIVYWIFSEGDFIGSGAQILLLHGVAGSGKSRLARAIGDRCNELELPVASLVFPNPLLGNDMNKFISHLAYAMWLSVPGIRQKIGEAIRNNPGIFSDSDDLEDQMSCLIIQPLSEFQYDRRRLFVMIIDGLPEIAIPIVVGLFTNLNEKLKKFLNWKIVITSPLLLEDHNMKSGLLADPTLVHKIGFPKKYEPGVQPKYLIS